MKYTVKFAGTEEAMTNQAWDATLNYLGSLQKKLREVKEDGETEGSEERSEQAALLVGMFWGIEGHYSHLALKEFFIGTRKIPRTRTQRPVFSEYAPSEGV